MERKGKDKVPGRTRKADQEDRRNYSRMVDKSRVHIRLSAKLLAILEADMRKFGFINVSGYIKYKVFGLEPERRVSEMIRRKSQDELTILLRNEVMALTECFIYIRMRYEKDMNQLWKEEGVNLSQWISATNHWQSETSKRMEELLNTVRAIAAKLGLDEYFELPSSSMDIDLDKATPQELDALAQQLRKERIAMGRFDEM